MGLVDAILFVYFLFMAIVAPVFDFHICFPSLLKYPNFLVHLISWEIREFDDYLVAERPPFFVGVIAAQLFVQSPLSIANLYAMPMLANKSWYPLTCLIQGVSAFTGMVAILSEMWGSHRASGKLWMVNAPFIGFALLAVLRALVPVSRKTTSIHAARSSATAKKRA